MSWKSLDNWLRRYRKPNFYFGTPSTIVQTIGKSPVMQHRVILFSSVLILWFVVTGSPEGFRCECSEVLQGPGGRDSLGGRTVGPDGRQDGHQCSGGSTGKNRWINWPNSFSKCQPYIQPITKRPVILYNCIENANLLLHLSKYIFILDHCFTDYFII